MTTNQVHSSIKPVDQPLNLIPVGLKEAALDSPTFRATSLHFEEQVDLAEKWLDGIVKAASKLVAEISNLESTVNAFLAQSAPPPHVSEAILDHDYSLLAIRRHGEGAREYWNQTFRGVRKYDATVIEPIKSFCNNELRTFKDARKTLDASQKTFDAVITRYAGQSKTKEASSLREDAFQLHEARKAYLKSSMDFGVAAPQLRTSLDHLVVRVFADQWKDMRTSRDASAATFARISGEMERIRGWSREMENSERAFKHELLMARRQIEDSASQLVKPSRELVDYEPVPPPLTATGMTPAQTKAGAEERSEKQGWLFFKTIVAKPTRTVWIRRWVFVKSGIFGWLVQGSRSGGVEESEKIGVLLCGVRPAAQEERRFCFEVKTKDASIVLQAETQTELSEWISTFEMAKRRALQDPSTSETPFVAPGVDAAFAISPPIAPEFAANAGAIDHRNEDLGLGHSVSDRETSIASAQQRASFDVGSSRRLMSSDREPGERSRDHAARFIQKLDIHKRDSGPSPQPSPAMPPAGGIASLISASHSVMPVGPGALQGVTPDSSASTPKRNFTGSSAMSSSTLAPNTLANPPVQTNLSHTAVVVSGERNVSMGSRTDGSTMPSGIMANLWGSSNWAHVNRLADDIQQSRHQRSTSQPSSAEPRTTTTDDVGVMDGTGEMAGSLVQQLSDTKYAHRKTVSNVAASTDLNLPAQIAKTRADDIEEFPKNYPLALKAQHAQFRMLFPSVPRSEKVVLVFRATWNPNEQQEFPGRVYVTTKDIYFYSHHLGLVLITGISMSAISDVSAAPGRDCDFLYLHLKDGTRADGRRRITIRVFLDSLRLLQRRLNFMIRNANAEEPAGVEEVLTALIKLETAKPERSSSMESWEDTASAYDDTLAGASTSPQYNRDQNVKATIRIDGSLYGDPARTGRDVQKFQLPRQAVIYAPQDMQASVAREYNVSAKALFHLVFGDKSAVFQLLYANRWADQIVQTPWTKDERGHWSRRFTSQGERTPMADTQSVDILNDHLCYVVTNHKIPWRLPYSNRFHLITKVVISHSAKSKCKLSCFQRINWNKAPSAPYIRNLIEKQALNALEADALDLTNVAMDQVAKLGNYSKTTKAVEIFGDIGQQSTTPQLDTAAATNLGGKITERKQAQTVSLTRLVASDMFVRILRGLSMALDVLIAIGKSALGICTTHTLLVVVLTFSLAYNSWYGYRDTQIWWQERSTTRYMAQLGVRPSPILGRAIYLADIHDLLMPTIGNETVSAFTARPEKVKTCRTTFGEQLSTTVRSVGTAGRVQRSRDALAKYRHDLLVGLRVVNNLERDVILAEWEDWVHAEDKKCSRAELLLNQPRKSSKSGEELQEPGTEHLDDRFRADFAAYCASCRSAMAGLKRMTALT